MGVGPLRALINSLGGWPVLDRGAWAARGDGGAGGEGWRVEALMGRLRQYNMPVFVESWVGADDKNSSNNVIQVS